MNICRVFPILCMLGTLIGCQGARVEVVQMPDPDYPLTARIKGVQGLVEVTVVIGSDGRVISATAKGSDQLLIEAARQNALAWVFKPFSSDLQARTTHIISYSYKLEGRPSFVDRAPMIDRDLPNSITVRATPIVSDFPPPLPDKPK
jgi:hypothetical protein